MKILEQLITAIIIFLFTVIPICSFGQSSSGNNIPGFGKFLGYDDAQDLDFKTNNILRLQLMESQTNTINGFPGIAQVVFL